MMRVAVGCVAMLATTLVATSRMSADAAPSGTPAVVAVNRPTATPGDEISVHGASFGRRRGRVRIGGRRARVVNWSDDEIVVRVPERCAHGVHGVVVRRGRRAVGATPGLLTVAATDPGARPEKTPRDRVSITIQGKRPRTQKILESYIGGDGRFVLTSTRVSKLKTISGTVTTCQPAFFPIFCDTSSYSRSYQYVHGFSIVLPVDPAALDAGPVTLRPDPNALETEGVRGFRRDRVTWSGYREAAAYSDLTDWTVVLERAPDGRITGSASGMLNGRLLDATFTTTLTHEPDRD